MEMPAVLPGYAPTIQSIQVRAVRVPMAQPHQTAGGVITESPLVLTDITTSDGVRGHSMIFTYTTIALKPVADLIHNMESLIIGERLAHDFRGHAQIARAAETPIQCGENWWGPLDVQHALDAQASDLMMLDVMKIGGVTGWMRAAALAYARGVPISCHLWPEISAQLLCLTPTAHWLEYADWWSPILREPLQIRDGMAVVADAPGTGVAWDEAAVMRFLA